VLQVHHRDRDRTNNEPVNLEVLCPTCHDEDHFFSKDGKWSSKCKTKKAKHWPPRITPQRVARLVETSSYSAVARKHGVAPNTVKNFLIKNGCSVSRTKRV
jgi:hypothetical protein